MVAVLDLIANINENGRIFEDGEATQSILAVGFVPNYLDVLYKRVPFRRPWTEKKDLKPVIWNVIGLMLSPVR